MRIFWFRIKPFSSASLQALASGMLAAKYDDVVGRGYNLSDVRKTWIVGRHIEKEVISRTFEDPTGEEVTSTMESFRATGFTLRTTLPHLEIVDPSRRLSELLTSIGDLLDNRIAISPIVSATGDWLSALRECGGEIETTRIVTSSIALSDSSSVKATFSGKSDVESQMKRLFPKRTVVPDSVSGTINLDGATARFRVGAGGVFRFASHPGDEILALVRESAALVAERSLNTSSDC